MVEQEHGGSAHLQSIASIRNALVSGQTTAQTLVRACLDRICDKDGEGARTFSAVNESAALLQATFYDDTRAAGLPLPPFAGIPIAVKDNFDQAGQVTTAGSVVLQSAPPAPCDAPVVTRLKQVGFIPIGRTSMTEFAYSGLGLNPHYGTPLNPYDRSVGRIPGGSSSGSAIAVTDGMAVAGLGTDTGGSCRIPASFCGLTGFKPTSSRISKAGVYPLSQTLDAVGSLAHTVSCCETLDAIMAGENSGSTDKYPLAHVRIGVPQSFVFADVTEPVRSAFQAGLKMLSDVGTIVEDTAAKSLGDLSDINAKGGFAAAESYAQLRPLLCADADAFDPRVSVRVLRGREQNAADYIDLIGARRNFMARFAEETSGYDVLAFPTVPFTAPTFEDVDGDADYGRINLLALRNPSVANVLDRPAISIPLPVGKALPIGFMLMGKPRQDRHLLRIARSVEAAFACCR